MINKKDVTLKTSPRFSVYKYRGETLQEILCIYFTKINECIDDVNKYTEMVKDMLEWIHNEGLEKEVKEQLRIWREDGTLAEVINEEIFADLNNRLGIAETKVNNIKQLFINAVDYGIVGSGDETSKIQSMFNSLPNNTKLIFKPGDYLITKPILIKQKKNLTIDATGCRFYTNIHGNGIFEFNFCLDCSIIGKPVIEGSNTWYPAYDGGKGEKHKALSSWDYVRNNPPSHAGQAFGRGKLGSAGIGVMVINGCERISINAELRYFNYAGISVGFVGEEKQAVNKDIVVDNCFIHDIYNAGITLTCVDGFHTTGSNIIKDIGMKGITVSSTIVDPGYGIASTSVLTTVQNVAIKNTYITKCVRKGIDAHFGSNFNIENNIVKYCIDCGIYSAYTSSSQKVQDVLIKNNYVYRCGTKRALSEGGIFLQGLVDGTTEENKVNSVIEGNTLEECGGNSGIISCRRFFNLAVKDNHVKNSYDLACTGIFLGRQSDMTSYNLLCQGNTVQVFQGGLNKGIDVGTVVNGIVANNTVMITTSTESVGIQDRATGTNIAYNSNTVLTSAAGSTPIAISAPAIKDLTNGNIAVGGKIYDTNRGMMVSRFIVRLNSTTKPTIEDAQGFKFVEKYVKRVDTTTTGFSIIFKEGSLRENCVPFVDYDLGSTGITGVDYAYKRAVSKDAIEIGLKNLGEPVVGSTVSGPIVIDIAI